MKRLILLLGGTIISAIVAYMVLAVTPLVEPEWVNANIGQPGIVFLDLRTPSVYKKGHVPGAVYTSYKKDGWRVKNVEGIIGMLPPVDQISTLIGKLGISNEDHVELLPQGKNSSEMSTAMRVYWTFKMLGHDRVSILNGGMNAYKKAKKPSYPLETGENTPLAKTFRSDFRQDWVLSKAQVKQVLDAEAVFVDSRKGDQFYGLNKHPKAKRLGAITGEVNVTQNRLTVGEKRTFRNKKDLRKIMIAQGVPSSGTVIIYCNSGQSASIDWFVLSELLANNEARMYNGSMIEWSADPAMPMEQRIIL